MFESLELDIGIITWQNKPERIEYLERCIRRFRTYLHKQERIRFLCSVETDGVSFESLSKIEWICRGYHVDLIWNRGSACIGANINNLFSNMKTDYLFLAEDDRLLMRELDLIHDLDVLKNHLDVSLINYSTTKDRKRLCLQGLGELDGFYIISPISPWVAVNMQLLFQKGFVNKYGLYCEDVKNPDMAEREMNLRLKNANTLGLYVPDPYFDYCGKVSAINRLKVS